jgi:hypothetical protein
MCGVKLVAVGDICLQTANDGCPFKNVEQVFADKDILFGNLETVLSENHGLSHLLQCIRWFTSLFVIKCYLGFVRKKFRKYD